MASLFDRWEKDPFFSAAEEVQESADRMESIFRTWMHSKKDAAGVWNSEELRRDLRTALGTTKWQLEEFERAVRSSYSNNTADGAKDRHREFVVATKSHISRMESSLNESVASHGKPPLPWVCLDEGERNELALFLSGTPLQVEKNSTKFHVREEQSLDPQETDRLMPQISRNTRHSVEWRSSEAREEKLPGHRRTASASVGANIGALKISVADDVLPLNSNERQGLPPRKLPSFSALLSSVETASNLNWAKNGYRKLKVSDPHQEAGIPLSHPQQVNGGVNACYERSKSCLDGCDDYNKHIYGWHGAIQRLLQRSQYQMQYGRPVQMIFWFFLLLCLIVLLALRVT